MQFKLTVVVALHDVKAKFVEFAKNLIKNLNLKILFQNLAPNHVT